MQCSGVPCMQCHDWWCCVCGGKEKWTGKWWRRKVRWYRGEKSFYFIIRDKQRCIMWMVVQFLWGCLWAKAFIVNKEEVKSSVRCVRWKTWSMWKYMYLNTPVKDVGNWGVRGEIQWNIRTVVVWWRTNTLDGERIYLFMCTGNVCGQCASAHLYGSYLYENQSINVFSKFLFVKCERRRCYGVRWQSLWNDEETVVVKRRGDTLDGGRLFSNCAVYVWSFCLWSFRSQFSVPY